VPMHFGMSAADAVDEFAKVVRYGVLPRPGVDSAEGKRTEERRRRT
jgi:hypothetical protein